MVLLAVYFLHIGHPGFLNSPETAAQIEAEEVKAGGDS